MSDILNHSGSVSLTDPKDSWYINLIAGEKYHYEAQNTDNHGQFNFVVKAETVNYGEVPLDEDWIKVVKVNVDPGKTETGSFTAPRSFYGINADDPEGQEAIEKTSYIRVSVNWVLTIYNSNYKIRLYQ